MRLLAGLLALAVTLPAAARAGDRFDDLAASAEKVEALEPFLARYLGHCTDVYTRVACEQNVAAARKAVTGRTFAVRVPDAAALVKPTLEGERFLLLVTPFVDGGGLALTNGAPSGQDAEGRPRVGFIPIKGTLPPGTMEMEFASPFRTGAVELEIVFRPEKAWKLKRKGEAGSYDGVAARFLGVRVVDARTGTTIASKVM